MSYDPCFPFRVSIVNQNIFLEALLPWAKVWKVVAKGHNIPLLSSFILPSLRSSLNERTSEANSNYGPVAMRWSRPGGRPPFNSNLCLMHTTWIENAFFPCFPKWARSWSRCRINIHMELPPFYETPVSLCFGKRDSIDSGIVLQWSYSFNIIGDQ
jgi:hypothetical protein